MKFYTYKEFIDDLNVENCDPLLVVNTFDRCKIMRAADPTDIHIGGRGMIFESDESVGLFFYLSLGIKLIEIFEEEYQILAQKKIVYFCTKRSKEIYESKVKMIERLYDK